MSWITVVKGVDMSQSFWKIFFSLFFLWRNLYLLDLVPWAGDALCDALVGPNGSGEFCIMLNDKLVQMSVTRLERVLETTLFGLSVLHIITAGQSPTCEIMEV